MKCSFCGHELEPGSNFCPECGTMMSVDDDVSSAVSDEQKYEPDSADAYSKDVSEEDVHETEPTEEEMGVPEYIPQPTGAFEDYNTIRRNEEEAEAALAAAAAADEAAAEEEEEDDPFAELHPDAEPVSFSSEKKDESEEHSSSFDEDDMYVKPSKSKKGGITIAVLSLVLVAAIVVGVNAVRSSGGDILSVFKRTTASDTSDSSASKTTESTSESKTSTTKKDEKSTTDKTTKESTTKNNDKTTEGTSESKASTTESTTRSASSAASTTEATTTRAYTTTTTQPSTTKQQTTSNTYTRPSQTTTTSPKPTSESLQKPSKYYSSPVTRYASENGISIRLRPSASSTVRASISVGGEVKVYAQENGFYYVYYARYGVYGWVNGSYLSKERPVADTEVKVSGVVKPDKTYANPETKTVTTSEGLRLRKGPGTNYDTIRYLGKGYPVAVKGTSSKNPGWVYVTDITRGVSGWVSAAYIK